MGKDKIQRVAKLAQSSKQQSALELNSSRKDHQANRDQLEQLHRFKQEYEERLGHLGGQGMDSRQLQDYRQFLSRLNQAIGQQHSELEASEQKLQAAQDHCLEKSRRSMVLDEVVDRQQQRQQQERDSAEQKASDEESLARINRDLQNR